MPTVLRRLPPPRANQPMKSTSAHQELAEIFPPDRLLDSEGCLASFQSDGLTAFAQRPIAIVVPETEEEVVLAVCWCHRHGIPFVARGSGTSLSGGSLPCADGIVIALNRLNRILKVDPEERIAIVQPGAINLAVSKAARQFGLYYAPDPSSQQVCTIGGNVAFNSGGAHCLKYGMTANHVLGMRVVLPDGEIVELGSSGLEMAGPDSAGLFVGSEGLFGIALQVTLRLLPLPQAVHTVMAGYNTIEQAGDAVSQIIAAGLLPAALEIMDSLAIEAASVAVGAKYPPGVEAVLIVELDGPESQVESERSQLEPLLKHSNPVEIVVAQNDTERAILWRGRKSAFSAVGRLSPDFIVQDSVVPRTKLGEALREIKSMASRAGLRVANVFHAGDGNLHPLILFDGNIAGELEQAEALATEIVGLCVRLGGSITGEHGVGMEKRYLMPAMFSETDIDAMRRIRLAIDPGELSNPGKMFPGPEAPSLAMTGLHPLEKAGVLSRE